jgi:hypothetical protein
VQSLTSALQAFDVEIAEQASAEAAAADRKVREGTARELCNRADRIEKGLTPLLAAVRNSAADIETSRQIVGEIGIFELFARLHAELPPAFALIAGELRARAAMTLDGHAPAALPKPEPQPVAAEPIPRHIFALKDIKWRNPARPQEFELAERFAFVSVPVELAHKALENGIAVLPDSEQAQKWKFNKRGGPPIPEKCIDLNTGEMPKPPSAPIPWNLQVLDRGPPQRMTLSPPATFEPIAARSVPNNNESNDDHR